VSYTALKGLPGRRRLAQRLRRKCEANGGNIADGVANIIKLFKIDPNVALANQTELAKLQFDLQGKMLDTITAQTQVNLAEAQSKSIFVAGWRTSWRSKATPKPNTA
jgi:hypothetical protein